MTERASSKGGEAASQRASGRARVGGASNKKGASLPSSSARRAQSRCGNEVSREADCTRADRRATSPGGKPSGGLAAVAASAATAGDDAVSWGS
jgi:hypothetical protein